jgi:hypothetical protein
MKFSGHRLRTSVPLERLRRGAGTGCLLECVSIGSFSRRLASLVGCRSRLTAIVHCEPEDGNACARCATDLAVYEQSDPKRRCWWQSWKLNLFWNPFLRLADDTEPFLGAQGPIDRLACTPNRAMPPSATDSTGND